MKLLKWNKGGMKSTLARARGLGAAGEGVDHWINQRVTAIANIPLTLWFLYSMAQGVALDFDTFTTWLSAPVNAILMILFVISTFYHAYLGNTVVVEDYIHNEGFKIFKLVGLKLFYFAASVACVFSILKISFGI